MVNKPLTVARNDYMAALCNLTNQSNLPAFVVLEVLNRFASEVEKLAEAQLTRDTAAYRQALDEEAQRAEASKAETSTQTHHDLG